jgi:hypothetical protein
MSKLPTFDFIKKYREDAAKNLEKAQKFQQEVAQAEALKQALTFRYEEAVKAQVIDGADNAKELEEISELLDRAERDLSNKKRAQIVARSVSKPTVTKEDVDREFRVFLAMYNNETLANAAKDILKKKEAYINAELEYARLVEHGKGQASLAASVVYPNSISVPYQVSGYKTAQDRRQKTLSEGDLLELATGKKPRSLEPITKPVKGQDGITRFVPIDEENEGGNE